MFACNVVRKDNILFTLLLFIFRFTADFRAAFVDGTGPAFSVEPTEGSLSKDTTNFNVRFKPDRQGVQTYLSGATVAIMGAGCLHFVPFFVSRKSYGLSVQRTCTSSY